MNALTNYPVPQWIAIAFLVAIPLPFILIVRFLANETKQTEHKKTSLFVMLFFMLYISYIAFASNRGWFNHVSLPPKVLLWTTFPFAFLLFVVIANTKLYKKIIENTTLASLVKLHLFRLIGIFFILLALHDALPKPFAFIAGMGDMLTAMSSVFVARAIQNKKSYAKKLTLYWNVFGTLDILFTAVAANVLTKISIDTGAMGVDALATFPYCIIPAFAPPMILFLHWAIFQKLRKFSA